MTEVRDTTTHNEGRDNTSRDQGHDTR